MTAGGIVVLLDFDLFRFVFRHETCSFRGTNTIRDMVNRQYSQK